MMAKNRLSQIRASAGSGKTWRLTTEYIENLAKASARGRIDAATAQGVLAVTFTNAAAEEMRERVLKRLKEDYFAGEESGTDAGKWLDIFLREPFALNIRTIDSVLGQIVRASALDLGINPDFQIEFDTAGLFDPHVELALENARKPGAERELLQEACNAVLDFDQPSGFGAGMKILTPLRDVLEDTLGGKFADLSPVEELLAIYKQLPDRAVAAASRLLQLAPRGHSAWKSARDSGAVERYANGDFTQTISKTALKNADELFKNPVPESLREAAYAFKKAAADLYFRGELLKRGMRYKPFIDLAGHIVRIYRQTQGQFGSAPQKMMPIWASAALTSQDGVPEALLRMGTRLTHFLVDEFQDTSGEQWQVLQALVLEALSRGGSFTWVGDVKQSIYGWRGGDVRLFGAPLHDSALTAVAPEPLITTLTSNWRSLPEIVEHTNRFFKPLETPAGAANVAAALLGKDAPRELLDEAAINLQEAFADVCQKCEHDKGERGFVVAEEVGPNSDSLVNPLCARVRDALLDDIGPRRPWSDVLILVRGNTQARELAEGLGDAGIPVITENGLLLNENPLVTQIIALIKFLNDPNDDVAFWTLITGSIFATHPLNNFGSESGLAGWVADRERSISRQFARDFPDAWNQLLAPFYLRRNLMTAYDTASEWLSHMEVKKRFPDDAIMVTRLLEVIYQAENQGHVTLAGFLEYWQAVNDDEMAPMPEKMNAVRIMTIHKAKGLEAPVVIVPGIDFSIKATDKPMLCHVDELAVVTKCVKGIGEEYQRETMRQALESMNLVYVALTRPKEELYLFLSAYGNSNSNTLKEAIRHLLATAGLRLPYSYGSRKPAPEDHKMELARCDLPVISSEELKPADPKWRPMKWLPRLKFYHTELASSCLTASQRGVVLHTCFEYLKFDRDHRMAAEAALASGLSASTIFVPEQERPGLLDALLWFMDNTPFADWLERGLREQPLVDDEGNLLRADMIVPESWGPLVIDYKSGSPHPHDESQIRKYMDTLARSQEFSGTPCGLLIYLDKKCFKKIGGPKTINLNKQNAGKPGALHKTESGFFSQLPPLP